MTGTDPIPPSKAEYRPETAPARELLVFDLAGQRYALPVERVREVLPRPALVALPEGEPGLCGVLRLRGGLLRVVDLRRRLGLPAIAPSLGQCVVVALVEGAPVGLVVDGVLGLAWAEAARALALGEHPARLVERVVECGGQVVTVLDADALGSVGPSAERP